jgi:predicted metal-dependent hydrolase|uniref:M48 metallopeptidase family protein n=1 Tax=Candidatus Planktophila sp. TaxID=2175601 RepID=UPI0040492976
MQQSDYSGESLADSSVEKTLEESTLPGITEGEIVVIRSSRRKKNISAYRQGGRIVVSIPARMSKADERAMVPEMVAKIRAQEAEATMSEESLQIRAGQLLTEFAPEIVVRPASVNWRAMRERWGSCTGLDRSIRISDRLKGAPEYVLDYVLFHEAIHLEFFDHGEQFKRLLARFPLEAQAEAYLQGYEAAENALTAPEALKKLLNKGA